MTKLDRFSQLAPPSGDDAGEPGDAGPESSRRFEQIDVRAAPSATGDPFSPPASEAEVPLQLVYEESREAAAARESKRARAKAELVEHVEQVLQNTPPAITKPENGLHTLARLGHGRLLVVGLALSLLLLADELGPWVWFVGPAVLALVGASYVVTRGD